MRPIGICLLVALLAAPAFAADDEYANVHTVAVISVVGDVEMKSLNDIRLTDTPNYRLPPDTRLDAFVTAQVADALKSRFTVIQVAPERFPAAAWPVGLVSSAFDKMRTQLRADPALANVDAYVVVAPRTVDIMGSIWTGLSVTHAHGIFGRDTTGLWAVYTVTVYDAKTGDRIDYGTAKLAHNGLAVAATKQCDNVLWAETPDKLTAAQTHQIGDEFEATISQSLTVALEASRLIPDAGDPADIASWDGRPLVCHKY